MLSEVPEMFGAEQLLMNRAADRKTFDKHVAMINRFKDYFLSNHQVVYENPSPGNKAGGITTLEEKSLGCIQKAGTALINDVLDYGEPIQKKGVSLVYRCVSETGFVSSCSLRAVSRLPFPAIQN